MIKEFLPSIGPLEERKETVYHATRMMNDAVHDANDPDADDYN